MGIIPERYDVHNRSLRLGANPGSEPLGYAAGQLGYATQIATQSWIVGTTDLIGASVSVTVGANRRIKITGSIKAFRTVPDGTTRLHIQEGAAVLLIIDSQQNIANDILTSIGSVVITPTSGIHTYKLTLGRVTGSGTVGSLVSGGGDIGYILVEDIGAA